MKNRIQGIAIPLVLFAFVILFAISLFLTVQSRREVTFQKSENMNLRFTEVTDRMRRILDSTSLCTCNLRDIETNTGAVGSRTAILNPGMANIKTAFGFYDLTAGSPQDCVSATPADVVLHLLDPNLTSPYAKAMRVDSVRIEGFEDQGIPPDAQGYRKYKAQFKFVASSAGSTAKNNLNNPISLDVYLEALPLPSTDLRIKRCYAGAPVAAPSPGPSSPPPSGPACGVSVGDTIDTSGGFSITMNNCCLTTTNEPTNGNVCCTYLLQAGSNCRCIVDRPNGACP